MSEMYRSLNIVLQNQTDHAIPASLSETKTSAILENQQDWKVSICRFKLPLYSVPLFKFNTNANHYQLTLRWESAVLGHAYSATHSVQWLDDDGIHLNTPDADKNIFYYSQFLHMINYTLLTAWNDLQPAVNAIEGINLHNYSGNPEISYNPETKLFTLVCPIENVGAVNNNLESVFDIENSIFGNPPAPGAPIAGNYHRVSVIFNNHLFNFFNGFSALRVDTGGMNYEYHLQILQPKGSLVEGTYFNEENPPEKYLLFKADYPCLYSWHRLTRILFLTNMNIIGESVSTNVPALANQANHISLLTDYEIPPSEQSNREYLFHWPTFLRYTNFSGVGSLRQVSITVFYETLDGEYLPLYLPPNSDIFIKLQFTKLKSILLYRPAEIAIDDAKKLK